MTDPAKSHWVFQISEAKDPVDLFLVLNHMNLVVLKKIRFLGFSKNLSLGNKYSEFKLTHLTSLYCLYILHRCEYSSNKFVRVKVS